MTRSFSLAGMCPVPDIERMNTKNTENITQVVPPAVPFDCSIYGYHSGDLKPLCGPPLVLFLLTAQPVPLASATSYD